VTRRRAALLVATVFVSALGVGTVGVWGAHDTAARATAAADVPARDADYAFNEAAIFFGNPFEQLLIVAYGVTFHEVTHGRIECERSHHGGVVQVVTAYTVFGLEAGRLLIDCDGGARRLRAGEMPERDGD
jgi:hypothetical protein